MTLVTGEVKMEMVEEEVEGQVPYLSLSLSRICAQLLLHVSSA
jgi:hypothetical protein